MKIAIAASEAAPYIKTGGLGDVMQALPLALSRLPKNEVSLFLPYYGAIKYSGKYIQRKLISIIIVNIILYFLHKKSISIVAFDFYIFDSSIYFC